MAEEKRETIIVNPVSENKETIFPTLGLSKFEKQMKAFNSYSALTKFRNETGISPAFDYNTLGEYTTGNLLDLKNYGASKFSVDYLGRATVATPTADYHAATKKYVDDNAGLWEVDGSETQLKTADEIDMQSKKIINLTDPTADQHAATKKYVDDNSGETGYTYASATDNLRLSADAERHTSSTSYNKKKEIQVGYSGTYKVKFDLKNETGQTNSYGKIYKNGVELGTQHYTMSTTYVTFSENIDVEAGDLIQLYIQTGYADYPAYTRNFRIYFDKTSIGYGVVKLN